MTQQLYLQFKTKHSKPCVQPFWQNVDIKVFVGTLQKSRYTLILFKDGFRSAVCLFINIKTNNPKIHTVNIRHTKGFYMTSDASLEWCHDAQFRVSVYYFCNNATWAQKKRSGKAVWLNENLNVMA